MSNIKMVFAIALIILGSFGNTLASPSDSNVSNPSVDGYNSNVSQLLKKPPTKVKPEPNITIIKKIEPTEIKEFKAKYGKPSKVEWDPEANALRSVGGLSYSIAERVATKGDAQRLSMKFIEDTKSLWKVDVSDLQLLEAEYNKFNETFGRWVINYQQFYRGIPVHKSYLGASINSNGKLRGASSGIYYNISAPTTPEITKEQAVDIAKKEIEKYVQVNITPNETEIAGDASRLIIFPEKEENQITFHLTWKVKLRNNLIFVDAITGDMVLGKSLLRYGTFRIQGTVTGDIYPEKPSDSVASRPFSSQYVQVWDDDIGGDDLMKEATTQSDGSYNTGSIDDSNWDPLPDPEADVYVKAMLEGSHVKIIDNDPIIPC